MTHEVLFGIFAFQCSTKMNKSIKGTKDAGTCSVCWAEYKVQKKDGTLHKHGHGGPNGGPCPGSYKPPNSTITTETRKSDIHIKDSRSAQPPAKTDATPSPRLEHPMWKATMNRIPKAARAQCATAFGDILIKIANEPTNLQRWNTLLSFGPTILAKPPRGGTNRNRANVVLKRLAGCNDNPSAVPDTKIRNRRINTKYQDARSSNQEQT